MFYKLYFIDKLVQNKFISIMKPVHCKEKTFHKNQNITARTDTMEMRISTKNSTFTLLIRA